MGRCCVLVLVGFGVFGSSVAEAATFGYRKSISIDKSKVGVSGSGVNTLTNFPMLFSVTDGALSTTSVSSGRVTSPSGYDIIFRALDTTTCGGATSCTLSHQMESYTPLTGNVIAWVKLPSVNTINAGSSTVFYVYYGNSSVTSSSERATDVWDSSFKGVWHLSEDPSGSAPQAKDSTSNANNCTSGGSMGAGDLVAGEIGNGWNFQDATGDDHANCASNSSLDAIVNLTLSAWIHPTGWNAVANFIADKRHSAGVGWNLQVFSPGYMDYLNEWTTAGEFRSTSNSVITTTSWQYVGVTYNGSSSSNVPILYVNGASTAVTVIQGPSGTLKDDSAQDMWIGNRVSTNRNFVGDIDELHIANTIRSADWIKTEYSNQSSPTTFNFQGTEVSGPPTAIRLYELGARRRGAATEIGWSTGHEIDNLGFYVHREVRGRRSLLTPSLIAGSALFAGAGTTLPTGASYAWLDEAPLPAGTQVRYWLEEVDLGGKSTFHGPVWPAVKPAREPGLTRSALLHDVGRKDFEFRRTERRTGYPDPGVRGTRLTAEAMGAGVVRLKVREEGWYRVDLGSLRAAGLSADPTMLRVVADGEEQAILPTGDGFELYGLGADTPWTDERAYFVTAGGGEGRRVVRKEASGGEAAEGSFPVTLERRDRSVYFAALKNGDADNFFGPVVTQKPVDLPVTALAMASGAGAPASVEVTLQGVSGGSHEVEIALNGTTLGRATFEGQGRGAFSSDLPGGLLVEGENKVTLVSRSDGDVSLVDVVRVRYPRAYRAAGNVLRFPIAKGQSVTVRGFTRPDVRAMDVSDASAPVELAGTVVPDGDTFALTLAPAGGATEVLAFTGVAVKAPAAIEARSPLVLDPAADMAIVSPRSFFAGLRPLIGRREGEGHVVELVDIEDVFDAYGFGQKTPYALRRFFENAKETGALKYALLVGDASFDPRNHLGMGNFDLVPTKLVETSLLETASDDWLADFDGDLVPDLALGRLPVRTLGEVAALVDKIVSYRATSRSVLIVSGRDDEGGFGTDGARILSQLPAGISGRHLVVDALGIEETRKQMFAAMKQGPGIVEYLGHGSVGVWADGLLGRADVDLGTGGNRASVFVPMTCLNGFFHDVYSESLAESLLKARQGGAVAVWASSGLTQPDQQFPLGESFVRAALQESATLGEAARKAKAEARSEDVRRTWVLLGDPSMRIAESSSTGPAAGTDGDAFGCQCRLHRQARSAPGAGLLLGLLLFIRRRRRRR